jgi:hypothetical protein
MVSRKAEGNFGGQLEFMLGTSTLVTFCTIVGMVMVNIFMPTGRSLTANGPPDTKRAPVASCTRMEIFLKEIGQMEKEMAILFLLSQMGTAILPFLRRAIAKDLGTESKNILKSF